MVTGLVVVDTRLRAGGSRARITAGARDFFSSPKRADLLWGTIFVFVGYWGSCPVVERLGREVKNEWIFTSILVYMRLWRGPGRFLVF
jgi:hypothetical protein